MKFAVIKGNTHNLIKRSRRRWGLMIRATQFSHLQDGFAQSDDLSNPNEAFLSAVQSHSFIQQHSFAYPRELHYARQ